MKAKKFLAVLFSLTLILSGLVFTVSADDSVVLEVSSVQACGGDEIEVSISIANNPGIALIGFNIGYDSSVLELLEVTNGNVFPDKDIEDGNISVNPYAFLAMNSKMDNTADGVLTILKFKVSDTAKYGISDITLRGVEIFNINEETVKYEVINGWCEVYDPNGPLLTVAEAKGFRNKTVDVTIEVENNPGIALLGFELGYDSSVFTLVENDYYKVGDVFAEDDFYEGNPAKNPYTFSFVNGMGNVSGDGKLITFTFAINENAQEGFYPVTIKKTEAYSHDENDVHFVGLSGFINVKSVEPGDVNEDGVVNRQDLLRLAKSFAGWQVTICEDAADVTGDGIVNRQDLLRLAKFFAGWQVELG